MSKKCIRTYLNSNIDYSYFIILSFLFWIFIKIAPKKLNTKKRKKVCLQYAHGDQKPKA